MQVSLENGPVIQMKPVVGSQAADFYGVFRGEIVLKNNARSVVPVKLSLAEVRLIIYITVLLICHR